MVLQAPTTDVEVDRVVQAPAAVVEANIVVQAPAAETLTRWTKVQLARHPQRPHTRDYIQHLCRDFVELRGDRSFGNDQAIVGGIGRTPLGTVVVVGHQKDRNTRENGGRNLGMAHPEGYRKALRLMRHAEKFGMPLVCFLDTRGADPDPRSEERGQAQAIAQTLMKMASLKVPIVATVIGEGGSGGALALGLADRLLMLEHSVYSVATPEASASHFWRDPRCAPEAAEAMKITAQDLLELGIVDQIIPEPLGGAHTDPHATITAVVEAVLCQLDPLRNLQPWELVSYRTAKYRGIGSFRVEPWLDIPDRV